MEFFRGFVWTIRFLFFHSPRDADRNKIFWKKKRNFILCWITKRTHIYRLEWNELVWNVFCVWIIPETRDAFRMKCIKMYSKNSFCCSFGYSLCSSFVARVQSVFGFECIIIAPFFLFIVCFWCGTKNEFFFLNWNILGIDFHVLVLQRYGQCSEKCFALIWSLQNLKKNVWKEWLKRICWNEILGEKERQRQRQNDKTFNFCFWFFFCCFYWNCIWIVLKSNITFENIVKI